MSALLELRGVTAFYGKAQALFGVDLTIEPGQVAAILGRNGMGKTTTVRTICRLLPHREGSVRFAGRDLSAMAPHQVARLGVGLAPEGRRCFAPLSVWENLTAAARPAPDGGGWDWAAITKLFPRLEERRDQTAATLSGGEQQMLAISRALMTNPRLLILDEATEGLAPVIRQEIWSALARLKTEGLSILIIDKNLKEILALADHCAVFERGRSVWSGAPATLSAEVRDAYLGV